jgi:CRP-like cAMP-binding protein
LRLADGAVTPLDLGRTLKIVTRLAEALAHAHDRGVVHLDLKPQNIVVLAHDEVVLVDWGSARVFAPERHVGKLDGHPDLQRLAPLPEEDDTLLIGTPRYMSPEQTEQPRSSLGPASDVFSLGVLFYQMLTGRAPFVGESLEELLFHIRETEPAPPSVLDRGIHPRLSSIVMRMLAKAPADRYPSLDTMLRELEAFRSTAAEFPIETFAAGERIFSEGDEGRAAYVIVAGEVEISTGRDAERRVLTRNVEGEVFGELALLGDVPRTADATALTETALRVIDRAALSTEVDRLSPWVGAILAGVVERFVDRSERLVELLRDQH